MATSNTQEQAYEQLMEYGLDGSWVGPIVLSVCIVLSTMGILTDFQSAYQACRSVLHLRGDKTIIKSSTKIEFIAISNLRVLCFLVVQLCRMLIAAWLWFGGTFFLVYTVDITELMLNVVALRVRLRFTTLQDASQKFALEFLMYHTCQIILWCVHFCSSFSISTRR